MTIDPFPVAARRSHAWAVAGAVGARVVAYWQLLLFSAIVAARVADRAVHGGRSVDHDDHRGSLRPAIGDTMEPDALTAWKDDRLVRAQRDGAVDDGILPAGNVSGAIDDLVRVAEFVPSLVTDAAAVLESLGRRIVR